MFTLRDMNSMGYFLNNCIPWANKLCKYSFVSYLEESATLISIINVLRNLVIMVSEFLMHNF